MDLDFKSSENKKKMITSNLDHKKQNKTKTEKERKEEETERGPKMLYSDTHCQWMIENLSEVMHLLGL